jgi:cellulose synthase/poly-beta-1,6-N-acetylglucosamine synthase-like glycosyltransferase
LVVEYLELEPIGCINIMSILMLIFSILSWLIFGYLAFCTAYILFFSIAGRMYPEQVYVEASKPQNIAVFIPSFKEDSIILHTAQIAASHDYPNDHFSVYIIADHLKPETIAALQSIPQTTVIPVSFDISTKAKSLQTAISGIDPLRFPISMILDADNVMAKHCLYQVNEAFKAGARVVQCHRTAKNQESAVSLLDGISEEINNNIFRSGQCFIGHPSAIIGSGMAFETGLIQEILSKPGLVDNPGEDREIDVELLKRQIDVKFLKGTYVYDEKVPNAAVFQKQRIRWLEAQFMHLKLLSSPAIKKSVQGGVYWNKFIQTLLLPRILLIGIFGILTIALLLSAWFLDVSYWNPAPIYWWICIIAYFFGLIISVPVRYFSWNTVKALAKIPTLVFAMFKSLLQVKPGRKEFIHTPKSFQHPDASIK